MSLIDDYEDEREREGYPQDHFVPGQRIEYVGWEGHQYHVPSLIGQQGTVTFFDPGDDEINPCLEIKWDRPERVLAAVYASAGGDTSGSGFRLPRFFKHV